ncbi:hypothetical protein [Nocardioides limicola]|uniref:hypothetical protein n=1 Tax=Nocardioides limicola TaxID=2803368 RepID=UPI00193B11D3|nr:hypothetical protein [Nocardioides sp. DJM-14]
MTATRRRRPFGPVRDLGYVLQFRLATARNHRGRWAVVAMLTLSALVAVLPAYIPGAGQEGAAVDTLILLSSGYVAFLVLVSISAISSGGGRELIPRDQAAPFPISPATDHLGALLLAPLNIAWLMQAWLLLGATAFGVGTQYLFWAQCVCVLWILAATAIGQAVAWTVEAVRRGPAGVALVRSVGVAALASAAVIWATGNISTLLDRSPSVWLVVALIVGPGKIWVNVVLAVLSMAVLATVVGIWPARWAASRMPRDEQRLESGSHPPRAEPRSDLAALVRVDRTSVWRAVPMRRGAAMLALAPGVIAAAGRIGWDSMTVLPGLVISGAVLLFGVNVWSLDGRGALWRANLPVSPGLVFTARCWVLTEFVVLAALVSLAVAAVGAGVPTGGEVVALACTLVVVTTQAVGSGMLWSVRNPHAVDLRSARATPAPPVTMVGYSARLAVVTTLTGVLFAGLARFGAWELSLACATPLLLFALRRLVRARAEWLDSDRRAQVIATVAA